MQLKMVNRKQGVALLILQSHWVPVSPPLPPGRRNASPSGTKQTSWIDLNSETGAASTTEARTMAKGAARGASREQRRGSA